MPFDERQEPRVVLPSLVRSHSKCSRQLKPIAPLQMLANVQLVLNSHLAAMSCARFIVDDLQTTIGTKDSP